MPRSWSTWPHTRSGWVSLVLAGTTIVVWGSMPMIVQLREALDLAPQAGLIVVIVLGVLTVVAILLGWVSIGLRRDKSVLLLIGTCMVSGILLLAVLGEGIESIMMSQEMVPDSAD